MDLVRVCIQGEEVLEQLVQRYVQSHPLRYRLNMSTVDGASTNMTMTIMNSTEQCHQPVQCNFTLAQAKKVCPPENFWKEGEAFGCMSDCKLKGGEEYCGRGGPPSDFNMHLCPNAYFWASDDVARGSSHVMNDCPVGPRSMKILIQ